MFKIHTVLLGFLCISLQTQAQKFLESYQKGNYEKALEQAEKAIEKDSKNMDAYLYKSLAYMHLATNEETRGDHVFGIESSLSTLKFLTAKDKQKTYLPAHRQQVDSIINAASACAFELFDADKLSRVEKMIDKLIDLSPRPEHYFLKGKLLIENGDEIAAIKIYNIAAAKIYIDHKNGILPEPYLFEVFVELSNSLYNDYDFASACVIYKRAFNIFNTDDVENACYDFLSEAGTSLNAYSNHDAFELYIRYTDTLMFFVKETKIFYDLKWQAVQTYYINLVDENMFDRADSLMMAQGCNNDDAITLITDRIISNTEIVYDLSNRVIKNRREELSILLKVLDCTKKPSDNEGMIVKAVESLLNENKFTGASKLLYNLKLVSSNKTLLASAENTIYQNIQKLPDTVLTTTVNLYEIFQYFPNNKNLKTLQQNTSLIVIEKYIREKKFREAGELLRNQLKLYPKDASLRSLYKTWVIEDYKINYLGSETEYGKLGWTGSYDNCDAGNIAEITNQKLLQRLNYVRRLAGVPDQCVLRDEWNKKCQAAALMMGANGTLSHSPEKTWKCYTDEGYAGASNSNLSLGASDVDALMGQLDDGGIPSVGHRRWILCPYRKVYGHGSNGRSMVLWALGGKDANYPEEITNKFETQYVAWPPEGFVPANFACQYWSFSLSSANFDKVSIEMYDGSKKIECKILEEEYGYGLSTIVWVPQDVINFFQQETTYTVIIKNVSIYAWGGAADEETNGPKNFTYTVTFVPISSY